MRIITLLLCLFCLSFVAGCSTGEAAPTKAAPGYKSVLIKDVPHVRQKPDFCGEACAEMYLRKLGRDLDQDFVFDQANLAPELGRGCYTRDLATALKKIGFQIGSTWNRVAPNNAAKEMDAQFAAVHRDLLAGVPSILCMHYNDQPNTTEHFRLVLGYDATTDEIIYHEPAKDDGEYLRMKRSLLIKLWPLKYDSRQWTVVRMPLKPGRLIDGRTSREFTDADYAQHGRGNLSA